MPSRTKNKKTFKNRLQRRIVAPTIKNIKIHQNETRLSPKIRQAFFDRISAQLDKDDSKTTQLDSPRSKGFNANKPHEYGEKLTAEEAAALKYTESIQSKESARRLKNLKKSPLDTTKSSTRAKKKKKKKQCSIQGGKKRKRKTKRRKRKKKSKKHNRKRKTKRRR